MQGYVLNIIMNLFFYGIISINYTLMAIIILLTYLSTHITSFENSYQSDRDYGRERKKEHTQHTYFSVDINFFLDA